MRLRKASLQISNYKLQKRKRKPRLEEMTRNKRKISHLRYSIKKKKHGDFQVLKKDDDDEDEFINEKDDDDDEDEFNNDTPKTDTLQQEQQQEQQEYQQQDQQELQDQQEYKEEQEHKEEQEYQQQDQQQPEQIYDMRSRSQDLVWTDHEYTMLQLQQQPQQQQQITDQLSSKRQDFNTIQNDNEIIQQQHYSELPILENIDRHLTLPPPQQQHGSQITTEGEAVLQLQQQQQQEDYHNYDNHQQQYYPDALALEVSEVENNLNKNICERTFFEKSVLSKIQEDLDKILRDTRDEHSIFISFRDVVSYDNNKLVSTVYVYSTSSNMYQVQNIEPNIDTFIYRQPWTVKKMMVEILDIMNNMMSLREYGPSQRIVVNFKRDIDRLFSYRIRIELDPDQTQHETHKYKILYRYL